MIDIAILRANPEAVRENMRKKFQEGKLHLVDEALKLDKEYREALTRASELRSLRNKLSKEIGQFMREGKREEAENNKRRVGEMAQELKELEAKEIELEPQLKEVMMKIPNFIDASVPVGKDDSENVEIQKYGDPFVPLGAGQGLLRGHGLRDAGGGYRRHRLGDAPQSGERRGDAVSLSHSRPRLSP